MVNKFFTLVSRSDIPKIFETENYIWEREDTKKMGGHAGIESFHTVTFRIKSKATKSVQFLYLLQKKNVSIETYHAAVEDMQYDYYRSEYDGIWYFRKHNLTKETLQPLIKEFTHFLGTL